VRNPERIGGGGDVFGRTVYPLSDKTGDVRADTRQLSQPDGASGLEQRLLRPKETLCATLAAKPTELEDEMIRPQAPIVLQFPHLSDQPASLAPRPRA
jgi:hypothetical protein